MNGDIHPSVGFLEEFVTIWDGVVVAGENEFLEAVAIGVGDFGANIGVD